MFRTFLIAFAACLLASCDRSPNAAPAVEAALREWRTEPDRVTAEALRAAIDGEDAQRFYKGLNWAAVWNQDRVDQLLGVLGQADAHALEHVRFLAETAPEEPAAKEAALTRAALAYAQALSRGRVDPKRIWSIYTVPQSDADVVRGLAAALSAGELRAWFDSLAPQTEEYRALSAAYRDYRRQAAAPGAAIAGGDLIKPGSTDPRVPRIVEALRANGYLAEPAAEGPEAQRYTRPIAAAVARLQGDYGIEADGIVGPATLDVLNAGPADRARQLAVNLERRRWLHRSPPATRIDVNTAATFLDYWRGGGHRGRRRVVVGQPDWVTPQLGSPIFRLVANPSWTVPRSIQEEEIGPKGPGYMARNNMVWRDGWIVQLPGPDNALGLVKFDMQNDHSIYLHDTPAKALFADNERHRSHGCIRVENALQFAAMLAADNGILPDFEEALATGEEERFVKLRSQVPVRLLYHTVFIDGGGVRFRTDAYGWDEDVAEALRMPKRARRTLRSHVQDVGP